MAVSDQQKIDFLLKKIGYTKTKTGSVDGTGSVSGTPKQPFAEAIASPLVVPNSSLWNEADSIPATPPNSDTNQVKVYSTTSAIRMTADATSSGNRAYIAYSTYNDTSSARLTNWIDTQFGSLYLIKVFKNDPTVPANNLSAGATNENWFFDYSAGVLNFNDTTVPSHSDIYIVGYRYIGQTGAPSSGISTFSFLDLTVERNLDVGKQGGISTFRNNLDVSSTSTFSDDIIVGTGATIGFGSTAYFNHNVEIVKDRILKVGEIGIKWFDVIDAAYISTPSGGSNQLIVQSPGITLQDGTGNKYFKANSTNTRLFHNGPERLRTTDNGISISNGMIPGTSNPYLGTMTALDVNTSFLNVSGNSVFSGISTFTDIDVDGHTELDNVNVVGITTFNNNVQLLDNDKLQFGDSQDLEILHENALNASRVINHTGILRFESNDYEFKDKDNGDMMMKLIHDGSVELYHDNEFKFKTTGSGINVSGTTTTTGLDVTGVSTFTGAIDANGDLDVDGHTNLDNVSITGITTFFPTGTTTRFFTNIDAQGNIDLNGDLDVDGHTNLDNVSIAGVTTVTGMLQIPDGGGSSNRISVGDSEDLKIYHTGNTSTISHNNGSGDLILDALSTGSDIRLRSDAEFKVEVGGSTHIQVYKNGGVSFHQAGTGAGKKLETISSGARVTGTLDVTDGITVAGNIDANGDLDVDGHTNLDNVSIAGVTSVASLTSGRVVLAGTGGKLEDSNNLTFDGTTLGLTGNANFTGNLTVGGVLTYEDVKNVDAVGLITARSGIRVTSGVIEAQAGENKIPSLYSDLTNLPSASSYHGLFAHVHATGRGYFAHAANWLELVNKETNGVVGTGTETYNIGNLVSTSSTTTSLNVTGVSTIGDLNVIDLDVDGHTNLDNVSVAGVTTFSENVQIVRSSGFGSLTIQGGQDSNASINLKADAGDDNGDHWQIKSVWSDNDFVIANDTSGALVEKLAIATDGTVSITNKLQISGNSTEINFVDNNNNPDYRITVNGGKFRVQNTSNGNADVIEVLDTGYVNFDNGITVGLDLDVDGHTNLDNVSVAGVSTFTNDIIVNGLTVGKGANSASNNTVLGADALNAAVSGVNNTAVGAYALTNNTSANANTAMGSGALFDVQTGQQNTALGRRAMRYTTASDNTAVGADALFSNNSGQQNTTAGTFSGYNLVSGSNNLILGYNAQATATNTSNEITLGNSNITHLRVPGIGVSFNSAAGTQLGIVTATELDISGDIDVDGHTNLDNVSISGITTVTNSAGVADFKPIQLEKSATTGATRIQFLENGTNKGGITYSHDNNRIEIQTESNGKVRFNDVTNAQFALLDGSGLIVNGASGITAPAADINGDLDVDGHTNLDNVSISGIATVGILTATTLRGLNAKIYNNLEVDGPAWFDGGAEFGTRTFNKGYASIDTLGIATFSGVSVSGVSTFFDIDVDGHTNLDNLSVAGVTTFSNIVKINKPGTTELTSIYNNNAASLVINDTGSGAQIVLRGQSPKLIFDQSAGGNGSVYYDSGDLIFYKGVPVGNPSDVEVVRFNHSGVSVSGIVTATGADINGDLDVDGHTNLDNVSVAGVTTFAGNARFDSTITAGGSTGNNGQYLKSTGTGVAWENYPAARTATTYTATAGQTTFSFNYNVGYLDVFVNGVKLTASEFTATNGTSVIIAVSLFAGDTVDLVSYNTIVSGSGAFLANLIEDLTPELGGNLSLNSKNITGTGDININGQVNATTFVGDGSGLTGVVGSGSGIIVKDSGATVGTAGTINFGAQLELSTISNASVTVGVTTNQFNVNNFDSTGISSFRDIDVDGHTELDNVNVSGVITATTFSGNLSGNASGLSGTPSLALLDVDVDGHTELDNVNVSGVITATTYKGAIQATSGTFSSHVDVTGDLDVDGHTNLDNLSVAGVSTFSGNVGFAASIGTPTNVNINVGSNDELQLRYNGNIGTLDLFDDQAFCMAIRSAHTLILRAKFGINTPALGDGYGLNIDDVRFGPATSDYDMGSSLSPFGTLFAKQGNFSGICTAASFVGDGSGLTGVTASGVGIEIKDGGSIVGTAGTIDFGTGLAVSPASAGIVTVTSSPTALKDSGGNVKIQAQASGAIHSGVTTFSGGSVIINPPSATHATLTINSQESNDSPGPIINLSRNSGFFSSTEPLGEIRFVANSNKNYGKITGRTTNTGSGTEDGKIQVSAIKNGTETVVTEFTHNGVDIPFDLDVDGHTNLDNVSIAGVCTATTFSGDGSGLTGVAANVGITTNLTGTFSSTPGSPSTINTFGYSADDRVVEYTVLIEQGSNFQSQKVLAMRSGTTVHSTQFAVIFSNNLLVQCDATINSGNLILRATPETGVTGTISYRVKREVM